MSICVKLKSAYYGKKSVLSNIDFLCENGTITAIIGRNGSGKSSLVSAICQLIKYDGDIFANNTLLSSINENERAKIVSVIFQNVQAPHITVRDLVKFGRSPYLSLSKISENDISIINNAIKVAKLETIENNYLDEISGGELKRAYFGMMISQNTDNIILDEATAFMDRDYEKTFLELTKSVVKKINKCCIMVMHNLENAIKYADNILILENGNQVFFGSTNDVLMTDLIEKSFSLKRITSDGNVFFV